MWKKYVSLGVALLLSTCHGAPAFAAEFEYSALCRMSKGKENKPIACYVKMTTGTGHAHFKVFPYTADLQPFEMDWRYDNETDMEVCKVEGRPGKCIQTNVDVETCMISETKIKVCVIKESPEKRMDEE